MAGLVRQHQADVWRYLRFLGATAADADDLTQETFLAMPRAEFSERSRPETAAYLRTVARNQFLMFRCIQGREVGTVELTAAEQVWCEAIGPGGMEFLVALADCLTTLEGRARTAIKGFYREGLGRTEIAESDELLTLKIRYKQPDGDTSTKLEFPISDIGGSFAEASGDFKFAAAVASFGMLLRDSEHRGTTSCGAVLEFAGDGATRDPHGYRAELLGMVQQAKQLSGE